MSPTKLVAVATPVTTIPDGFVSNLEELTSPVKSPLTFPVTLPVNAP